MLAPRKISVCSSKRFTKLLVIFTAGLLAFQAKAQHTFSIVAVDSVTGEIGSAGATCGDSIIWPGTPGAKIISEIIPGKGAIHTQSYYLANNQKNAHTRMIAGDSPNEIINWLTLHDVENDETIRQYGIVDYNAGHPRSAAYTGSGCFDYKNHISGKHYSIQGNILIGQYVLDSMESFFNRTKGPLADKLMAAMQGAKIVGADSRCKPNGTSSLSAFIRVAKPSDQPLLLYLDLNIAGTTPGAEPIDKLQKKYDHWKSTLGHNTLVSRNPFGISYLPNPCTTKLNLSIEPSKADKIMLLDPFGRLVFCQNISAINSEIDMRPFTKGVYIMTFYKSGMLIHTSRVIKN